jgi:trigger factor
MYVTVEATSDLGRKMTVEVPADRIDPEVEKRLESMRKRVKIHGFRPGKVPFKVVKQRFGSQVQREVVNEVLIATYQEAVTQENLRAVGGPHIDIEANVIEAGKGLTYTATFEILPEIIFAPFDSMEITAPVAEVSELDIDNMIEKLRSQRKTWEKVSRSSETGDRVVIDFESRVDDEVVDSGKGISVELGSGRLLANLEDQLIGTSEGDIKNLQATYPENYSQKTLAGKMGMFTVYVKETLAAVLPDVDDELANSFGIATGGLQQFRQEIRKTMEREVVQKTKDYIKDQITSSLLALNLVELPEIMVREEISHARQQMMKMLGQSDESKFPDKLFDEEVRKRLAISILLNEIIRTQQIELDPVIVEEVLERVAANYEDPENIIRHYRSSEQHMARINALALEEQVIKWVMNKATVSEKHMSYNELVFPDLSETKS